MRRALALGAVLMTLGNIAAPASARPGATDPTFGSNGSIAIDVRPAFLAPAPGGGALYAGQKTGNFLEIARTLPDGTADAAYAAGGAFAAALTPGQLLAGVAFAHNGAARALIDDTPTSTLEVIGVTADGVGDSAYGPDGVVHPDTSTTRTWSDLHAPQIDPDDGITFTGQTVTDLGGGNSDVEPVIARLTPTGRLDNTFGSGGVVTLPAAAAGRVPDAFAVRADGGVVSAASGSANTVVVTGFTPTGALDGTFNGGTPLTITVPASISAEGPVAVAFDSDGRTFVVLATDEGRPAVLGLARNGTILPGYGTNGFATGPAFGGISGAVSGLVDHAGRVVVTGSGNAGVMVTRFTTTGHIDTGFGDNGLSAAYSPSGGSPYPSNNSVAEDADGHLLVFGADQYNIYFSDPTPFIARLRSDVNTPPVAGFTVTPAHPRAGQTIALHSTATDPDGRVADQFWDLDDDGAYDDDSGADATLHTTAAGTVTVRLKVYDDDGATTTAQQQITIGANALPVASFTTHPSPPSAGVTTFDAGASTDDGSVASYTWTFDDGTSTQSMTQATPTLDHALGYGTTKVTLVVTDNLGATSAPVTHTYTVADTPPTARITAFDSLTADRNATIELSGDTSSDPDGPIAAYAWDTDDDGQFDDGSHDTISVTYASIGDHPVKLRVTDTAGQTATTQIIVSIENDAPQVGDILYAYDGFTYEPHPLAVGASDPDSSDPVPVQWSTDGGTTFDAATGAEVTLTFAEPGDTTVVARAVDADGGVAATNPVTIHTTNRPPVASVVVTPSQPEPGETETADAHASYDPDGHVVSYAWDLDDDGTFEVAPSPSPTHVVTPGQTFRVQVTDNNGASTVATSNAPRARATHDAGVSTVPAPAACRPHLTRRVVLRASARSRTIRLARSAALPRGTRVTVRSLHGVLLAHGRAGRPLLRTAAGHHARLALARFQTASGSHTCAVALPVRVSTRPATSNR